MLELHLVSGYVARVGIRDAEWCLYHMSGSAGRARPWPWCSPTTELHVASDCAPLASGPTVTLSNMELCAKTHEVRHTPTPVRVSEVLHAATWGRGRGTTREGTAGTSTGAGPLVQLRSYSEHRGAQLGAALGPGGGRARGSNSLYNVL